MDKSEDSSLTKYCAKKSTDPVNEDFYKVVSGNETEIQEVLPQPVDQPTQNQNGGFARILVGVLSLIMMIAGGLVLIGKIEMPIWVGIMFASCGLMGGFLVALPQVVNLSVPAAPDTTPKKIDDKLGR